MNLSGIAKRSEKLVSANAPAILTGIGVVGTAVTAYLAARGAYKSAEENNHEDYNRGAAGNMPPLTKTEKLQRTWMNYVPATVSGVSTIACIVCANRISAGRLAALAAAYSLSDRRMMQYKNAVINKLGLEEEHKLNAEASKTNVEDAKPFKDMLILGSNEQLCFDAYSGRYFKSEMESIRGAANDINFRVIHDRFATLGDFWDLLGLEATAYSEDSGWTEDCPLEVRFRPMMSSDDKVCLLIEYDVAEVRGYKHLSL